MEVPEACDSIECVECKLESMNLLQRIRACWTKAQRGRGIVSRSVLCDDWGVAQSDWLGDREIQERLAWDEVDAVFGYKQDCYAVDRICIALVDSIGRARIIVSEEDAGYQVLVGQLPRRLAGCLSADEWFPQVAFPAFKANPTELCHRARKAPFQ